MARGADQHDAGGGADLAIRAIRSGPVFRQKTQKEFDGDGPELAGISAGLPASPPPFPPQSDLDAEEPVVCRRGAAVVERAGGTGNLMVKGVNVG